MQDANPKKDGEFRPATIAFVTVSIVLVCGAALPVGYHAGRIWKTRAVVRKYIEKHHAAFMRSGPGGYYGWDLEMLNASKEALSSLGGSDGAAERLAHYLRLPDWIAPHKEQAIRLLAECGEAGRPALRAALRHRDEKVRRSANWVLNPGAPLSARDRWDQMFWKMGCGLSDVSVGQATP